MATQEPDQAAAAVRGAPRDLFARLVLMLPALAGAAWFVLIAGAAGAIALGFTPAHGFARGLAAFMLAPAAALFAVPLVDAGMALLSGRQGHAAWTRVMAEALGALIVASCATTLTSALWPGIAALAFVAALGYLFGYGGWQPARTVSDRPASLPLFLLFDEPTGTAAGGGAIARPLPSERRAA